MPGSTSTPNNATNYRNETWLRNAYLTKNLTMSSIAAACGVSPMTIQNWLDRYGIPTRPRGRKQEYDSLKSDRATLLMQGLEAKPKENSE